MEGDFWGIFQGEITTNEARNDSLFFFFCFFVSILHFDHFSSTHMFNLFCFYMLIPLLIFPGVSYF